MKTRVLLGVGDPDLAASLRARLGELSDVEIAGVETVAGDVLNAVARDPEPDVVLVHQLVGGMSAVDLIRELGALHPQLAAVLITDDVTPESFGAAMEAGARGVMSREPSLSELETRIAAAGDWSRSVRRHLDPAQGGPPPSRTGVIVALSGAKGGTGTTLLAAHLALALVDAGRRVCLVDLDLQKGDIPSYLDITHRRSIADLGPAAADLDGTVLADALYVHRDGPHVLLAPAEGEQAEDVPPLAVRQILTALRTRYDMVIVDCGAYLTEAGAVTIETADTVLVTATPDLPCLRGVKRLSGLWERLSIRKPEDLSVVLVRHDRRNEVQPEFARKVLGVPILKATVPAVFRSLEEAINTGAPKTVEGDHYRKAVRAVAREAGLLEAGPVHAGRRPRPGRDKGVAIIEFAAVLPMVGLLLLGVWQTVLIGVTSMYAGHAANEGARAAAVLGTGTSAARAEIERRATERISGPWGDRRHFHLSVDGDHVYTSIDTPSVLPGIRVPFRVGTSARIVYESQEAAR
ncbi:MAG TPA: AAA family ATPase [Actinoallomurus sp.]